LDTYCDYYERRPVSTGRSPLILREYIAVKDDGPDDSFFVVLHYVSNMWNYLLLTIKRRAIRSFSKAQLYPRNGDDVCFKWTIWKAKRETPNHWLCPRLKYSEGGRSFVNLDEETSTYFRM
jgi:hypothetical protein